ncbi:hypothetical protein [Trabulsiella odontotermitis]|uniref:hypothetical protein n=1 Tax=Trabulsiella odontotermitis TaxID=379893 RepID=UPI00092CFF25|nr:hypothetical protein [Trabulsiella odontotermitis]
MTSPSCWKCKKSVDKNAKLCPYCATKYPVARPWQGCLFLIVIAAILISVSYHFLFGDSKPTQPQTTTESVSKPPENKPHKQNDCNLNDDQCLFNKYSYDVAYPCQKLVEKSARYEYEWTDGMFHPVLSRYVYNRKKELMVFMGDQVKFTNAFNAKSTMIYSCTFSIKQKRIVDFSIEEGKF